MAKWSIGPALMHLVQVASDENLKSCAHRTYSRRLRVWELALFFQALERVQPQPVSLRREDFNALLKCFNVNYGALNSSRWEELQCADDARLVSYSLQIFYREEARGVVPNHEKALQWLEEAARALNQYHRRPFQKLKSLLRPAQNVWRFRLEAWLHTFIAVARGGIEQQKKNAAETASAQ